MKRQTRMMMAGLLVMGMLPGARNAPGQVPGLLSHQGRIAVEGTNFTGAGQFKFALVNGGTNISRKATANAFIAGGFVVSNIVTDGGAGYSSVPAVSYTGGGGSNATAVALLGGGAVTALVVTSPGSGYGTPPTVNIDLPPTSMLYATYWSNDGASTTGGPPTAAVSLTVNRGLYSVLLGDTSLTGMTSIPAAVFTNASVWLRIWFNDGTHGFQLLTPDQRLAAVGYAQIAAAIIQGGVTSNMLATGAVTSEKLALGAVDSAHLSANAVGSGHIQNGGVSNADLAAGAVTADKILDGTIMAADISASSFSNTFWKANGNAGTSPGTHFLGTTDDTALELKANNRRVLRLEPNATSPNVIGGHSNNAVAAETYGNVIGGGGNAATPNTMGDGVSYATVAGGFGNNISADSGYGTVAGGYGNDIFSNAPYATISGGRANDILPNALCATIGGGTNNSIGQGSSCATVSGGNNNDIYSNTPCAAISGGRDNAILVNALCATIGGGADNRIAQNSSNATISGGFNNDIDNDSVCASVGGGWDNRIDTNSRCATIGGGRLNAIRESSEYTTVAGGLNNSIDSNSPYATIGGGHLSAIGANAGYVTIGGGRSHDISANSAYATVAGGYGNDIAADSPYAAVGGGYNNNMASNVAYSTIPGGKDNDIGVNAWYAFAAGRRAQANHDGAFVWGDSQDMDTTSSTSNEVTFRCKGGVRFTSGAGGATQTVSWVPGSADWSYTSDRNMKELFQPVDAQALLERVAGLPLSEWSFKGYAQRHIGPLAQDFHAAFPLNENDKQIDSGDLAGVSLAAIQGLYQLVKEKDARISQLETRLAELETLVRRPALSVKNLGKMGIENGE